MVSLRYLASRHRYLASIYLSHTWRVIVAIFSVVAEVFVDAVAVFSVATEVFAVTAQVFGDSVMSSHLPS